LLLFRLGFKKTYSFNTFIISIGNLTVGGTGKTPMTIYLSKLLFSQKIKHTVVSRGYKKKKEGTFVLSGPGSKKFSAVDCGDEPYLLNKELENIPVIVGEKNRAIDLSIKTFNAPVVLLDDGFQSYSILKNLNVLLVDLSRPKKDYFLLPSGLLREPLYQSKNADIVIFTKCNHKSPDAKNIRDNIIKNSKLDDSCFFDSDFVACVKQFSFNKREFVKCKNIIFEPCVAFSGIANPFVFNQSLKAFCKQVQTISFSDHQKYKKKHIQRIKEKLHETKSRNIITTLKDFYKVVDYFNGYNVFVLDVEHHIKNEKEFKEIFLNKIKTT
tara:strand:- start:156 stop:1133 length:978 start_codon:yes stop_codon:yes gene_type:complete